MSHPSGHKSRPSSQAKPKSNRPNKSGWQKNKPNKAKTKHKQNAPKVAKPTGLHPRNLHQGRYDFEKLEKASSELSKHVILNPRGEKTVNFSDPVAVMALNEALLKVHYELDFWQIPKGYLCPPIPGRADYIHYLADLIKQTQKKIKKLEHTEEQVEVDLISTPSANHKPVLLDIGTGANCIYPILGSRLYGWHFVASDIDPISVKTAKFIVEANKSLKGKIKVRQQSNQQQIFKGMIKPEDRFLATVCNPPFHESLEQARQGSLRKVNNLNKDGKPLKSKQQPVLNFAGTANELCCEGGEIAFLKQMALESKDFSDQVCWFTSLVSKKENVPLLLQQLKKLGVKDTQVVNMAQGQKMSRFVAWTFLSVAEQKELLR